MKPLKTIFITGTDTGIGKTFVSCLLLKALNALNLKTVGIKPIASGCEQDAEGCLKNEDALRLQAQASIMRPYHDVNPIAFKEPVAPHLAAHKVGIYLDDHQIERTILSLIQPDADIHILEGVGGWAVPLNETTLFSDIICALKIPIILVVGIKLGCLNHALLTYQSIISKKATFIGWIANCLEPNSLLIEENIQTLQHWIKQPCLGVISHDDASGHAIDVQTIWTKC